MLFKILTEYRNGNVNALNKLFTDMGTVTENPTYVNQIIIHDIPLMNTIKRTFEEYQKPYKTCRKKCISTFCGDIEDMKQLFITELYRLFDDDSFLPDNESSIFRALKYNVTRNIEESLKTQPLTSTLVLNNSEDDEEYELLPESLIYNPFQETPKGGYSGKNKALLSVIKSVDIESLCRKNAETQINVANIIKKYYKPLDDRFPDTKTMLSYYKKEYANEISDTEYSRALNSLFKLICDNTIQFKGLNINRKDYISKFDSEGNYRQEISPIIQYISYTSEETLFLIDLVNNLNGHIPKEIIGDKFYKLIQVGIVNDVCGKNKAVIRGINNLDSMTITDYADLLEAIYIMVNEYVKKQIDFQIKQFIYNNGNIVFDTGIENICRLALGKFTDKTFWTLKNKKDGLHIITLKKSECDLFTACKGKSSNIKINCTKIYQIGYCKFLVHEEQDERYIYCRSVKAELINLYRVKNKYSGCLLKGTKSVK